MNIKIDTEREVLERYAEASEAVQPTLCCSVDYDPKFLEVIPNEIIEKDYGCGDPSKHLREGDIVLDLGCGGGKICFIASQVVGATGRVIGVDFNPAMLDLARKHRPAIAESVGWDNVEFHYGKIQDLRIDYEALDQWIKANPISSSEDYRSFEQFRDGLAMNTPMIADEAVDIVISNCVLNLVRAEDKAQLFTEMFRVLKRGGRVAISDIVSDEQVPERLRNDPELWSGCISGAYQERDFLKTFEDAGFYGIRIEARDEEPWQVVEGIEFRSLTVSAYKGKDGASLERNQAVIYKGPWREVRDDDGSRFERGVPTAICEKTHSILSKEPYYEQLIQVSPAVEIPPKDAKSFDRQRPRERTPVELKGATYRNFEDSSDSCC